MLDLHVYPTEPTIACSRGDNLFDLDIQRKGGNDATAAVRQDKEFFARESSQKLHERSTEQHNPEFLNYR